MVMNMIRIRNLWGGLVLGACVMSGCAVDNNGRGAVPFEPPQQTVVTLPLACPAGTIKVCTDRLPRSKSCGCTSEQVFEVPVQLPIGGFSR